jgi:hypothetical protein
LLPCVLAIPPPCLQKQGPVTPRQKSAS